MTQPDDLWPIGDSEMAGRIRSFDWALTPLGPISRWPQSLKTIVDLMLTSHSVMSLVWGPEAIHLYNDSFTELLQEHRVLALGRSAYETFAQLRDVFEADVAAGMAGKSARLVGQRYPVLRRGHLSDAWFDVDYAPIRDEAGAVAGVLWTLKETTAQHLAERALRASEARHRLLIESWTQAVWETDANGVVVTDSPSWRAYTGQILDQWLGYGWLNAIHHDDRSYAERQWREAIATGGLVNAEFRLRAPDGEWRWTNVRAAPVRDEAGKVEKWVGINIDIDARKRAEAALKESETQYRLLFDSIDDGFCVLEVLFDEDGRSFDYRFLIVNPAFERQTGLRDPIGRTMLSMAPEHEPFWVETYGRIVRTGRSEQFDNRADALGRWYEVHATPIGEPGGNQVAVVFRDVLQRRKAEEALRESEERYRALFESMDEAYAVVDVLKDEAGAWADFRFVEVNPAFIAHTSMPWPVGQTATDLFGEPNPRWTQLFGQALDTGEAIRVEEAEPTLDRVFDLNIFTLDRDRNRVAVLFTNITERKRAEGALRESEERFRQFATASAAGLWIRDAGTLAMEFVSPAMTTIYGGNAEALLGDVTRWAAMIVPDDRDAALRHLEAARRGEAAGHEFRIQRLSDGAFRWVRNTEFPLRDNGCIPRIGGIAEDVTEAKLAAEHSTILLAELQHRVRNIMALLRAITDRTAERAESVSEYRDLMMGRLLAFARVQVLLTRTANVNVGIASLVRDEVSVQAQHKDQYRLEGPDVALSPKAAEVLMLAIHELTTNAVKYGALSAQDGKVTVRWSTFEKHGGPWLSFDWREEGAPARLAPAPDTPRRRGFGSELIEERIPYELRGRGQVTIEPGGARCRLEFPLQGGASILETSAPQRATVFGGAIDMTGEPDLTGRRVLVVEDDFYLATDVARVLRGAGAEVMGPCATEEDARAELAEQRPNAVVVDINLGLGPSFKLAETLKDSGIPFVFTTGYDAEVIPVEFENVERLEKPLQLRQVVGAVARLTSTATYSRVETLSTFRMQRDGVDIG